MQAEDLHAGIRAANGFTEAELAMNREGRIAATQIPRLLASALSGWILLAVAVLPMWVVLSAGLLLGAAGRDAANRLLLWGLWAAMAVYLGCYAAPVSRLFLLTFDLFGRSACCVEGRLSTSVSSDAVKEPVEEDYGSEDPWNRVYRTVHIERYWYVIDSERLPVERPAFEALHPYSGSSARVYLTTRSRMLLSLELDKVRTFPRAFGL